MSPVNVSGIGVAGNKFAIDGVAVLNLKLVTTEGFTHTLEYEPVLVTTAVDTCIFGIKTEMRFKEIRRSQEKMTFTFVTPESKEITIAYYREVDTKSSHAFIKVAETTVAKDFGIMWAEGDDIIEEKGDAE